MIHGWMTTDFRWECSLIRFFNENILYQFLIIFFKDSLVSHPIFQMISHKEHLNPPTEFSTSIKIQSRMQISFSLSFHPKFLILSYPNQRWFIKLPFPQRARIFHLISSFFADSDYLGAKHIKLFISNSEWINFHRIFFPAFEDFALASTLNNN